MSEACLWIIADAYVAHRRIYGVVGHENHTEHRELQEIVCVGILQIEKLIVREQILREFLRFDRPPRVAALIVLPDPEAEDADDEVHAKRRDCRMIE